MIKLRTRTRLGTVGILAIVGVMAATVDLSRAQEPKSAAPEVERIVKALGGIPEGKTRGFSLQGKKPLSAKHRAVIEAVKKGKTRGLSIGWVNDLAEATASLPSIDLEVYFEFNSDEVNASSQETVNALGQALTNPSFSASTFLVGGHTDAKGGDDYNQNLSERRAAAVRRLLIQRYHLSESRLVAVGYGEKQLENSSLPDADENRRVQIVNLGDSAE
jgi:outer membrane protein OmpA-like peptidoglycan-associated protein